MARTRKGLARRPARILASPARVAQDTALALDLESATDSALADIDHGLWAGLSFAEIQSSDPISLARWVTDPTAGAPGGETMASVLDRITPWLAAQAGENVTTMAITHPTVIRACLAHALNISLRSTLQIDIAPLSTLSLSFNKQWRLQELRRI